MIYFDNAATSRYKPEIVYNAFNYYVREIGTSPGRGSYSLGIQASRMLYQTRKAINKFFDNSSKTNVIFTKNSTEAINLFLNGFLKKGDHVLISPYEHNAVLRPLHSLKQKGIIEYTVLPEKVFDNPRLELKKYFKTNTKLAAVTLASNLTGQIVFNREFSKVCKENGINVFVDASQGGGKGLISMQNDCIDYMAFTGHKDILGLPGVGGLCSKDQLDFPPLIQGGTGIHGEDYTNPRIYPEGYESGTLNMPAIWALKNAVEYIEVNKDKIKNQEYELTAYLTERMKDLKNITLYNADKPRVSTLCFNVKNMPSSTVVSILDKNGICVRGGIHCAILAHETLHTVQTGAVRVSMNYMNTKQEIDTFIGVLRELK